MAYLRTEELRSEFKQLLAARAATRQALPDVQDDEIRTFVAASARYGAPLSALTPEVLKWLRIHGLTDIYVVRRKSAGPESASRR
jgi:hypothetical protein